MNDELERMWKEATVVNLRYYPGMWLVGLRKPTKTSVRIASLQAEN
jgi:hypothetical protein